jgi:hypothetical protein
LPLIFTRHCTHSIIITNIFSHFFTMTYILLYLIDHPVTTYGHPCTCNVFWIVGVNFQKAG